ncbi:hypothetical protein SG26_16385 [Haloarcula sp. CBA1115]|uniref:hypothetical protein n=1 Tax=unclassified Haloarcula TaxID=2624677 RepID=UPI0005955648|nr:MULTISPECIES: hypothetical protein [unclassified Haloarcula]AJF27198.1 hypothetical protein SG26_16385 [Haloarcula sp. CBA1115]
MKWNVKEHSKPSDSEMMEMLRSGEWEWSRDDLMEKAPMYFLSVEQEMNTKEIFQFLIENTDEDEMFCKSDVTNSLHWWGLLPRASTPLQARASSIAQVMSFNWEL